MKLKATLFTILATLTCLANGVYFVSASDFRTPTAKWVMETTVPNQTVEITPNKARTLTVYSNPKYESEWSVKTEGQEFVFGKQDNIRQGTGAIGEAVGTLGATNIAPKTFTYQTPGNHLVKMYNPLGNVYQQTFSSPYITALWINDDRPTQDTFVLVTTIWNCPSLKKLVWNNPRGKQMGMTLSTTTINNATNIVDLQILHPEAFSSILNDTFKDYSKVTNDFIFPLAKYIGNSTFIYNQHIQYAYIPSATNIGSSAFNLARPNGSTVISKGLGLKKLCIGDGIRIVGVNTFYGHENLETIEFATDSQNWIDTWNNNTVISNWIGAAQATSNPNEANLIPQVGADGTYYSGTRRIGSNTARTIKIVKVAKPQY